MSDLVSYQLETIENAKIATITMDDGKANGLSPTMINAINEAFDKADADQALLMKHLIKPMLIKRLLF